MKNIGRGLLLRNVELAIQRIINQKGSFLCSGVIAKSISLRHAVLILTHFQCFQGHIYYLVIRLPLIKINNIGHLLPNSM